MYIDKKILAKEIAEYVASKDEPSSVRFKEASDALGRSFLRMAMELGRKYRFKGCDFEDVQQNQVLACLKNAHKFKPEKKTNAFNYFTSVMMNVGFQEWRTHKSLLRLKERFSDSLGVHSLTAPKTVDADGGE